MAQAIWTNPSPTSPARWLAEDETPEHGATEDRTDVPGESCFAKSLPATKVRTDPVGISPGYGASQVLIDNNSCNLDTLATMQHPHSYGGDDGFASYKKTETVKPLALPYSKKFQDDNSTGGLSQDVEEQEQPQPEGVGVPINDILSDQELKALLSMVPIDDTGAYTSIGSSDHDTGTCKKACLFVHTKVECQNGILCDFCHFHHKRMNKPRPCKGKRDRYRKLISRKEAEIEANPTAHQVRSNPFVVVSTVDETKEALRARVLSKIHSTPEVSLPPVPAPLAGMGLRGPPLNERRGPVHNDGPYPGPPQPTSLLLPRSRPVVSAQQQTGGIMNVNKPRDDWECEMINQKMQLKEHHAMQQQRLQQEQMREEMQLHRQMLHQKQRMQMPQQHQPMQMLNQQPHQLYQQQQQERDFQQQHQQQQRLNWNRSYGHSNNAPGCNGHVNAYTEEMSL